MNVTFYGKLLIGHGKRVNECPFNKMNVQDIRHEFEISVIDSIFSDNE